MDAAPGWYVNPQDSESERYWNGGSWSPGARTLSPDTVAFPAASSPHHATAEFDDPYQARMVSLATRQADAAERTAGYMATLVGITIALLLLGVITGFVLATK